jgi:hypothetical protein
MHMYYIVLCYACPFVVCIYMCVNVEFIYECMRVNDEGAVGQGACLVDRATFRAARLVPLNQNNRSLPCISITNALVH